MQTRLVFLVMLFFSFSCGTNNNPAPDAQNEKIKGEVKEVVNTFIKGCEEANADMVMESFLDSPDFVDITNGIIFSYKEIMAMKPNFGSILNQKSTMVNEKYTILDKSTVLYTTETKWSTNYKDGHSSITDPAALLFVFKKIDNRWKVIHLVDSNVEKNVPGKSSKGLNHAELLMKFIGNWEISPGNDTSEFVTIKSLQGGNGLSVYAKWVTKGKMLFDGTGFWGYDAAIDKIDISILLSTGDVVHDNAEFLSPTKMEYVNINNAKAYQGISKSTFEFISPDKIKLTVLVNNNPVISEWKRMK